MGCHVSPQTLLIPVGSGSAPLSAKQISRLRRRLESWLNEQSVNTLAHLVNIIELHLYQVKGNSAYRSVSAYIMQQRLSLYLLVC